jgi:hypothetical protein
VNEVPVPAAEELPAIDNTAVRQNKWPSGRVVAVT